jgi:hypothetical protein
VETGESEQLLLDAHIARVAYQQACVDRQMTIEGEAKVEVVRDDVETNNEGESEQVDARTNTLHDVIQQHEVSVANVTEDAPRRQTTKTTNNAKSQAKSHMFTLQKRASEEGISVVRGEPNNQTLASQKRNVNGEPKNRCIALQNRASSGMPFVVTGESKNISGNNDKPFASHVLVKPTHPRKMAKSSSKPAPPLPDHYRDFIRQITADPRVEHIINQFNTKFPLAEKSLFSAIAEDKEHAQALREAKREYYKDQLETMRTRLEMYTKLEEVIDKIAAEESTSRQAKNSRSHSKSHIRDVTMDLIHIGLNNYRLMEDNMDKILECETKDS